MSHIDICAILANYIPPLCLYRFLKICDIGGEYIYSRGNRYRGKRQIDGSIRYYIYTISYNNGCIKVQGEKYKMISKYMNNYLISRMRYELYSNDNYILRCYNILYYMTQKYSCIYYIDKVMIIYNLKYTRGYDKLLKINVIIRNNKYTINAITGEIETKTINRMEKIQRFPAKFNTFL